MERRTFSIEYKECALAELSAEDQRTVRQAVEASEHAYCPYSHFHVGAAVRLDNGVIVTGSNQENVAYPSGLCAERTALFAASAQYPETVMESLAIVGRDASGLLCTASPCGACRQVMAEYQSRQRQALRVMLYVSEDKILIFDGVEALLPWLFEM